MPDKIISPTRGVTNPDSENFTYFLGEFSRCRSFGFDLETFGEGEKGGLNPWVGKVRLIQISLDSQTTLVIDLGGREDDRSTLCRKLEKAGFWSLLGEKLEDETVLVM